MATPTNPRREPAKSTKRDWAIFAIFFVIMVGFLVIDPTWFWVPLPFVLTFFVKGIGYM